MATVDSNGLVSGSGYYTVYGTDTNPKADFSLTASTTLNANGCTVQVTYSESTKLYTYTLTQTNSSGTQTVVSTKTDTKPENITNAANIVIGDGSNIVAFDYSGVSLQTTGTGSIRIATGVTMEHSVLVTGTGGRIYTNAYIYDSVISTPLLYDLNRTDNSNLTGSYGIISNSTILGKGQSVVIDNTTVSGPTSDPIVNVQSAATYDLSSNTTGNNTEVSFAAGTHTINTAEIPCFLAGTIIKNSKGFISVEDLCIGDEILTYDWVNKKEIVKSISWIGSKHKVVNPILFNDKAGYPIRILKDAIADGMPFKDLLITAEHCLFFDGKFVPARMLVNGLSIFYDTSINSYEYYHIETEDHSVIMADGMLTESYLDTGNRNTFTQAGNVVSFTPSRNLSWDDAAAPLTVSRDDVEPIFFQIKTRAEQKEYDVKTLAQPLIHDHNLHLVTKTGAMIRQIREIDGRVMFMIPAGIESVWLVSNASRPCDIIGPFVDDRRKLGVLVGNVRLCEGDTILTLTAHLQDSELSGWNNVESETARWTNGNALLKLGQRPIGSIALVAIDIYAGGPYILEDSLPEHAVLQA